MFEQYTKQSNKTFMENPVIQFLADDLRWTVSDKKKRPVDARFLLDTHRVRNAHLENEPFPLVSLHELNADPNLNHTNRAYRLRAQHNHIIMIDVEPEADDELLQFAKDFPAHLTEISTNGGVHLLIALPNEAITPENEYLLTSTVIKSPKNDFEIICNDHYITFTKKLVMDKPIADYKNNIDDFNRLVSFLDNIVLMDAKTQEERLIKQELAIEFTDENIDEESLLKIMESDSFASFMEKQREKKPSDFNHDLSRYEGSVSTACAGHVYRFVKRLPDTEVLKDTFSHLTDNDWIFLAYMMTKYIVPERDKHEEYRDGLPWLLYNAQNGWTYICAKELQRAQEMETD